MTNQARACTTSSNNLRLTVKITAISSILLLLAMLFRVRRGFDFTDEGFYLNWFINTNDYDSAITFFGFFYSSIFKLFGESVSAIRAFNIVSLYLSGFIAISTCLHLTYGRLQSQHYSVVSPFLLSLGCASISLVSAGVQVTPNYNHLSVVGLQLLSSGLLYACLASPSNQTRIWSVIYRILFSTGFALICFAKIPTAIILTFLIVVLIFFGWKAGWSRKLPLYLLSAFIFTILLSVPFIGPLSHIISLLSNGQKDAYFLDGGHRPFDLLKSAIKAIFFWPPLPISLTFLLLQSFVCNTYFSRFYSKVFVRIVLLLLFVLIIAALPFAHLSNLPLYGYLLTRYVLLWFPALGVFALAARFSSFKQSKLNFSNPGPDTFLSYLLFSLPFCFAFGTNNNFWYQALNAPIFFFMSGLVASSSLDLNNHSVYRLSWVIKSFFVGLIPITLVVLVSIQKPYRQPLPLWSNSQSVCIRTCKNKLFLPRDIAVYIESSRALALAEGFEVDTPLLDLTGQSPGFVYAIGGKAIGSPWIIGHYPGSGFVANRVIGRIPDSILKKSWILVEPGDHDGSLSADILLRRGINLDDHSRYKIAAHISIPVGVGDKMYKRMQLLYKPIL